MQLYAIIGAAGTGALIIMEQDTLYLSFSEIPDASEILFKGEIPGIFVEEAIRSHSFSMVTRHFHESLELYFLIEGERFYFVEQDTYHLQEHMAILVDQNQIHKTCPAGTGKKHHRFLMQLEGPVLDQLLRLCGSVSLEEFGNAYRGITRFSVDQWAQILSLLTQIMEQFTLISSRTTPGNKQDTMTANGLIRLYTVQLLLLLIQIRRTQEEGGWKENLQNNLVHTGMYQQVHDIAIYLQNHCSEKNSLDQIATHFFISRSYLTRIFRKVTGFTITEYQNICRIKKAQLLLRETELSMTDIALEAGFINLPYFERVFRKTTSLTPLQYRRQMRPYS